MDIKIEDVMDLIEKNSDDELRKYSKTDKNKILKAYEFAECAHKDQYRCSGEPYITHPLYVAESLVKDNADADTICAGFLHDTIEDCNVTYKDIADAFNSDVANMVDGGTKMGDLIFPTKKERDFAYIRKMIMSITQDIRIILVKLKDREHNMSTLDFKPEDKQKKKAFETLHIFAPIANSKGAYQLKNELEDNSFKYLDSDNYKKILEKRELFYENYGSLLKEVTENIEKILIANGINPIGIDTRVKSLYSIYKKIREGQDFLSIQDLLSLKIYIEEMFDCYKSIYFIHDKYRPINCIRDYISSPSVNKYQAYHSTVMVTDNVPLQVQTKTPEMNMVDDYGLGSYWKLYGHNGHKKMQKDLKKYYTFYRTLSNYNQKYDNDTEFMYNVETLLSSDKIYVYNS